MKEGDFNKYHASLFLGMLSGSVSVGGPIWKDHTSFIVGGRMSYFDLMAYPILEKMYDDNEKLRSYSYKDYRYNGAVKIWCVYRKEVKADTIMCKSQYVKQYTLYAEDDYTISKNVKLNLGLRASLYAVKGKDYFSLEPRFLFRWQFLKHNAVKMSYSRMAQSTHRLVTNNLKSSSELWVPITSEIPFMKSDLWALGYVYEPMQGLSASVEGYYKTMNDIVEYKQNANYSMAMRDWSQMVAVGDGRSYGVEILLEKYSGNTTGWLSYTWSKALRKFDEAGNQLNGGREFYASNDRQTS